AKDVERTGLDQPLHFFIERIDAGEEIVERGEFAAVSFGEDRVPGALRKSFDVKDGDADGFINHTELRTRLVQRWRHKANAKAMAFEHIHQRTVKSLAVGEDR